MINSDMSTTINGPREYWLDLVKGLAMVFVVMQHTLQRVIQDFGNESLSFLSIVHWFVATVPMQWFFAASGLIYFAKRDKYLLSGKQFLRSRFLDLMVPYLILGPAVWLAKFALSAFVTKQVTLSDLCGMFATPIAFMWFIYVLFCVEIIVYAIDKMLRWRFEIVLGLLFFLYTAIQLTIGRGTNVLNLTLYYLFWYYLGGIFVRYHKILSENSKVLTIMGGGIWAFCFTLSIITKMHVFPILYSLGSTLFVYLLFQKHHSPTPPRRLLNYIGNMTMYVYILNPIIINGLRQVLLSVDIAANNITINIVAIFVGALVIACLIGELGKRVTPIGFIFTPRKVLNSYKRKIDIND